jgi:hypothetical protein
LDLFRIVFWETPAWTSQDKENFKNRVLATLFAAFQIFYGEKKFPAPTRPVTVYVKRLENQIYAMVEPMDPTKIYADPFMIQSAPRPIESIIAHEYFHVIHLWNSNPLSASVGILLENMQLISYNNWFLEGTAEWAADELFDKTPGHYTAPNGSRFLWPLNTHYQNKERDYQTVAFWKWLEAKKPGAILNIMNHHCSLTHSVCSSVINLYNEHEAHYLDSLTHLYPDLDFLKFITDVLYWKEFDQDENNKGDLWAIDKLGPPKKLPKNLDVSANTIELKLGGWGDGEHEKKPIHYKLKKHLSMGIRIITAKYLSGTLHVEFKQQEPEALKLAAVVISQDNHEEKRVTDLSTDEVTFGFGPGSKVAIIVADPQWKKPGDDETDLKINVWVEPCGGEIWKTGKLWDVGSVDDFLSAVKQAESGDTISLESGRYWLPNTLWEDWGGRTSLSINKDLTIEGMGPSETTLVLSGTDSGIFIGAYPGVIEQVSFKNLSIDDRSYFGPFSVWGNVRRFSLCNVVIESNQQDQWGLHWEGYGLGNQKLEVHGTSFICRDSCAQAIILSPVDFPSTPNLLLQLRDSSIWNWDVGVEYISAEGWGNVTLDIDCTKISGNQWNVVEYAPCGENKSCPVEHCPSVP